MSTADTLPNTATTRIIQHTFRVIPIITMLNMRAEISRYIAHHHGLKDVWEFNGIHLGKIRIDIELRGEFAYMRVVTHEDNAVNRRAILTHLRG